MQQAEAWLRERGIAPDKWSGMRFRHAENVTDSQWKSVVIEIERGNGEWIVTEIDRRPEPLSDVGLSIVS